MKYSERDSLVDAAVGYRCPLRAIVEIIDGELNVMPVAESDGDERQTLEALRLAVGKRR